MTNPIKILFLSSNPTNITHIRLDKEVREVDERIQLGNCRDQLQLIPHFAVRPQDLQLTLLRHQPHVLHFSGHGSPVDGIVLEDHNGQVTLVSAQSLATLIGIIKDNLRVVILNACYSALQAEGISQVVDCTIGMQKAIGDRSAIVFSAAFYSGLAFGRNVRESFDLGVNALMLEGIPESETPTLLERKGVDATKVYPVLLNEPAVVKEKVPPPGHQSISIEGSQISAGRDTHIGNSGTK